MQWIGLSSVLRPHQHNIGYMEDGFYRSKDPTNSIQCPLSKGAYNYFCSRLRIVTGLQWINESQFHANLLK